MDGTEYDNEYDDEYDGGVLLGGCAGCPYCGGDADGGVILGGEILGGEILGGALKGSVSLKAIQNATVTGTTGKKITLKEIKNLLNSARGLKILIKLILYKPSKKNKNIARRVTDLFQSGFVIKKNVMIPLLGEKPKKRKKAVTIKKVSPKNCGDKYYSRLKSESGRKKFVARCGSAPTQKVRRKANTCTTKYYDRLKTQKGKENFLKRCPSFQLPQETSIYEQMAEIETPQEYISDWDWNKSGLPITEADRRYWCKKLNLVPGNKRGVMSSQCKTWKY